MITLGIETSCDETALCLLETREKAGGQKDEVEYRILGNIVHSQIDLHRPYGGVFPMLAKREHLKNLPILYEQIKKETGLDETKIDRIAVTQGPGLEPALWTGILFAQELGAKHKIPVVPINHMEGHIVASLVSHSASHTEFQSLKSLIFPAVALLISGGHTELVKVNSLGSYELLGHTVDDAVGEAFDKVARMLELPYPGGPEISKLAEQARAENLPHVITLPRPMLHSKDLNFSFSGLKTAVLYTLKEMSKEKIQENIKPTQDQVKEISREFEDAVTEVIISKTRTALEAHAPESLIVGGGVIANKHIREALEQLATEQAVLLYLPVAGLSGDNALMIAVVGAIKPLADDKGFKAQGNLSL